MTWKIFNKAREINVGATAIPKVEGGAVVVSPPEGHREFKVIEPLDLMKVNFVGSPNKSARKGAVKYIVLHHTGPGSFNGIVKWLCNKQAKASAHYVLGTAGQLTQLVNTGKEAWHAGVASWKGKRIDNHCSIGIEICNYGILQKGDGGAFYYEQGRSLKKYTGSAKPVKASITYPSGRVLEGYAVPYPDKQIDKLVGLCKGIIKKYPQIKAEDILTHYEIRQPEGRKNDPFGLDVDEVITRMYL
jgi:N-acetylmuramoyl-L-alanine amidase